MGDSPPKKQTFTSEQYDVLLNLLANGNVVENFSRLAEMKTLLRLLRGEEKIDQDILKFWDDIISQAVSFHLKHMGNLLAANINEHNIKNREQYITTRAITNENINKIIEKGIQKKILLTPHVIPSVAQVPLTLQTFAQLFFPLDFLVYPAARLRRDDSGKLLEALQLNVRTQFDEVFATGIYLMPEVGTDSNGGALDVRCNACNNLFNTDIEDKISNPKIMSNDIFLCSGTPKHILFIRRKVLNRKLIKLMWQEAQLGFQFIIHGDDIQFHLPLSSKLYKLYVWNLPFTFFIPASFTLADIIARLSFMFKEHGGVVYSSPFVRRNMREFLQSQSLDEIVDNIRMNLDNMNYVDGDIDENTPISKSIYFKSKDTIRIIPR